MESYTELVEKLLSEDFTSYFLAKENDMSPQLIDNYRLDKSKVSHMRLANAEKLAMYYYEFKLHYRPFIFNNESQLLPSDKKLAEVGNFIIYIDEKRLTIKITWDKRYQSKPEKETPPLELKYSDYRKLSKLCLAYNEASEKEYEYVYNNILDLLTHDVCDYNNIDPYSYIDDPIFV